jgi:hypothetical protein
VISPDPDDQAESAGGYTEQTQEKDEENELRVTYILNDGGRDGSTTRTIHKMWQN